jgi:hypothetical protein
VQPWQVPAQNPLCRYALCPFSAASAACLVSVGLDFFANLIIMLKEFIVDEVERSFRFSFVCLCAWLFVSFVELLVSLFVRISFSWA